jgi:hypothetical protein
MAAIPIRAATAMMTGVVVFTDAAPAAAIAAMSIGGVGVGVWLGVVVCVAVFDGLEP